MQLPRTYLLLLWPLLHCSLLSSRGTIHPRAGLTLGLLSLSKTDLEVRLLCTFHVHNTPSNIRFSVTRVNWPLWHRSSQREGVGSQD